MRTWMLGVVAIGVGMCARALMHPAVSNAREPARHARVAVTSAPVEFGDLPVVTTALGRVAATPAARAVISSRAGGLVVDTLVRPGSHVDAGTIVLRIERAPLEAALARAQADSTAARSRKLVEDRTGREQKLRELTAAVDEATITLNSSRDTVARLAPLVRDHLVAANRGDEVAAEFAAAQRKYDIATSARSGFVAAVTELERDALDSASAAAELALDEATRTLADADVRAPICGEVAELFVGRGDRPAPGAPLGSMVSRADRELRFEVIPAIATRIIAGANATWSSASGASMHGVVRGTLGEIAAATGMATVLVDPDAAAPADALGLTIVGEIEIDRVHGAVIVPETAIVRGRDGAGEGAAVAAVSVNGIASFVPVTVLARNHGRVAVAGDLDAGTRVVVSGAFGLADGAAIREASGAE